MGEDLKRYRAAQVYAELAFARLWISCPGLLGGRRDAAMGAPTAPIED